MTEAEYMRVVVVRSPKVFRGLLCKLFGIPKVPREQYNT